MEIFWQLTLTLLIFVSLTLIFKLIGWFPTENADHVLISLFSPQNDEDENTFETTVRIGELLGKYPGRISFGRRPANFESKVIEAITGGFLDAGSDDLERRVNFVSERISEETKLLLYVAQAHMQDGNSLADVDGIYVPQLSETNTFVKGRSLND